MKSLYFPYAVLIPLVVLSLSMPSLAETSEAVFYAIDNNEANQTIFVNDACSNEVILVRSLPTNEFHIVPPGESATVFSNGIVSGSDLFESFLAQLKDTTTKAEYEVIEVKNMEQGPNETGPWRDIRVGDVLKTCTWYRRKTHHTSSIKVKDKATGEELEMPEVGGDTQFVIVPHHVPWDPRLENVNAFPDFANFNYAPMDITGDMAIVSGNSSLNPTSYQTGLRTAWGEAVIPHRRDPSLAWYADPLNGASEVDNSPDLSWRPGLWVADTNGHEVYFGTGFAEVNDANTSSAEYQGNIVGTWIDPCDANHVRYTCQVTGPLDLVTTYYWRVDEVNEAYIPGPVPAPPNGRWKGLVWCFEVEGRAKNPYPADGAVDVSPLVELSWTAGVDTNSHDVYFGTGWAGVNDANTFSVVYQGNQQLSDVNYMPGVLEFNRSYYWRIDEVNAATIKGHVWNLTTSDYIIVDDFESYETDANLRAVWDDYWVNGYDGEIFLETDPNIIREPDSQAAKLEFTNVTPLGGKQIGSYFDVQDLSELEVGSDWTIGGVKALFLYVRGDPCNAQVVLSDAKGNPLWEAATPWVELEDTSSNIGYVVHPNPEQMGWGIWNEWNIDLSIFDTCGVTLSAIDRLTIGIGGSEKTGQKSAMSGTGNIWVDDIRLYPPRCRPEVSELVGDFTADCNVDYFDVNVMATDWLMQDGNILTENRPATLTGFPDATSHWTTDCAVGTGAVKVSDGCDITVNDPRLYGLASMSITAWIKQPIDNEWVGIVSSREYTTCQDDATEMAIHGGPYCCDVDGLGYDWSCGTEEWQWGTGLEVPDGTWTFCAMVVDPCGCTMYMRPEGSALQTGLRNEVAHPIQQNFAEGFVIGRSDGRDGYFIGAIDDVRIYAYALDFNDVNNLAYQTAEPNPAPVYWYEFDETTGYTAADSGTPIYVYGPVQSVANLTDPEPKNSRFVNFADYAIFADNWMAQDLWP